MTVIPVDFKARHKAKKTAECERLMVECALMITGGGLKERCEWMKDPEKAIKASFKCIRERSKCPAAPALDLRPAYTPIEPD